MYGLKPVPFREERHTSGAKALINPAIYGTAQAQAVPFVRSSSPASNAGECLLAVQIGQLKNVLGKVCSFKESSRQAARAAELDRKSWVFREMWDTTKV
jgi:hypothetical protein